MYVPDPGLKFKLEQLLYDTGELYLDLKICCSDGHFYWNSLLLAASSKYLKDMMSEYSEYSENPVIILPNFELNTVKTLFWKLLESNMTSISQQELCLLDLLGIVQGEKRPVKKIIQIMSSSSPFFRTEQDCEDHSVSNLHQGDEDDVDIIFEEVETESEEESEVKPLVEVNVELTEDNRHSVDDSNQETSRGAAKETTKIEYVYDMQDKNQMIVKDETEEAIKKDEQRGETTNVKAPEARTTGSRELTCKICNLDFNAKGTESYRKHVASHKNTSGKFVCPKCDKTSDTWGHLVQHMYKHGGLELPHGCQFCDYRSINRANVVKHERIKHSDPNRREFKCPVCNKEFKTATNLAQHTRTHTNVRRACRTCNKRFKSQKGMEHHMREHSGGKIPCNVCTEEFLSVQSCKRHEKVWHGYYREVEGDKKFLCKIDQCSMEFLTEAEKKEHSNLYHLLKCDLCKFTTNNKVQIRVHRKECDGKRRPGKSLLRLEDNNSRIKFRKIETEAAKAVTVIENDISISTTEITQLDHSGTEITIESVEESPVEIYSSQQHDINSYFYDICKICKKIFVNFTEYVDHLKAEHNDVISNETEVDCNICSKTVGLFSLDDHLKLCHFYGSLFKCEPCDQTFGGLQEFENHNNEHHNHQDPVVVGAPGFSSPASSDLFTCSQCTKTFKTKTGVVRHIKSVHQSVHQKYRVQVGNIDELLILNQQVVPAVRRIQPS